MTCRKEFDTCRYCRLVRPQALLVKQSGRSAAAGDDPAQKYTGEVPMIPRAKRLLRPAVAILDPVFHKEAPEFITSHTEFGQTSTEPLHVAFFV
jgi:hypothetical protein